MGTKTIAGHDGTGVIQQAQQWHRHDGAGTAHDMMCIWQLLQQTDFFGSST
jgi:hypothetical protein